MSQVTVLLERLRAKNEADPEPLLRQRLGEAGRTLVRVPTLAKGKYVPISPMIRERFLFAGSWVNASCGQTWLSAEEMVRAWTGRNVQKHLAMAREHWEGHVLARHPAARLSLFGLDLEESGSTFLIWPESKGAEPTVVMYSGHDSRGFESLKTHLEWLIGENA